jgi:hypothetical protein
LGFRELRVTETRQGVLAAQLAWECYGRGEGFGRLRLGLHRAQLVSPRSQGETSTPPAVVLLRTTLQKRAILG